MFLEISQEICDIFKNTSFIEHLWATASEPNVTHFPESFRIFQKIYFSEHLRMVASAH